MRTYTTPELRIRLLKKSDKTPATDLSFNYLIFTLKHGCVRIDKRVESTEVEEGEFTIQLTQEETGAFPGDTSIDAEINFFNGSRRLATVIKKLRICDNLMDEVV